MVLKNGHFELLYPYAVDLHTGNRVVPFATGRLSSQDTARSFYNEAQHKGHLVCPECETAELVWRKGSAGAGSERITRDHFARRPDSEHDIHCQIGLLGLSYPDPIRFIDERKGGYVYGNFETVLTTAPFRKSFKYRTQLPDKLGHSKPDWIRRVQYGAGYKGFLEIISPDFIDSRRYNAVKDIKGLLELIKRVPRALLADTWVLRNHIAVRLDAMIVREVAPHNRVSQIAEEKQSLGLRSSGAAGSIASGPSETDGDPAGQATHPGRAFNFGDLRTFQYLPLPGPIGNGCQKSQSRRRAVGRWERADQSL